MTNEANFEQYEAYPFEVLSFNYQGGAGESESSAWEEERGYSRRRNAQGYGRNAGGYSARSMGQTRRQKGSFSPYSGKQPGGRFPKRPVRKPFPPQRFPYPWPMPVTILPDPYGAGQHNGGQQGTGQQGGSGSQGGQSMDAGSGDRGSEFVRWVQSALNQVMNLNLPVDGIMDAQIRSAIRSFQEKNHLPADGIVGPDTERALQSARAEQGSGPVGANGNGKSSSNGNGKVPDQGTGDEGTGSSEAEGEFYWPTKQPIWPAGQPQKRTATGPSVKPPSPKSTGNWLSPFTSSVIPKYKDRFGKLRATGCAVYVPKSAWKQAVMDLLIFFHGDPGPCSDTFDPDPKLTLKKFGLDVQIDASGRTIALAVPTMHWIAGQSDNVKNKGIWTAANLNLFVEEVLDQIGTQSGVKPKLGRLILAGHSHAYAVLSPLACEFEQDEKATKEGALARLKEVWALDTTYSLGHAHALEIWARKLPACRFSAVLSSRNGAAPLKTWQSYITLDDYCKAGIKIPQNLTMRSVTVLHCEIPAKEISTELSGGQGAQPARMKEVGFEGSFSGTDFEDYLWHMDEKEWNGGAPDQESP